MKAIVQTNFNFPGQTNLYRGKVRDVYTINNDLLVMVATDRISAFDIVLPKGIPYKGQILNQIASRFLDQTSDIVPNWKLATPDPNVTVGIRCEPLPVEMVIRAYITGSAWRAYEKGQRTISGITLPDGLKANQKLDKPIITPTTKAIEGHDEEISKEEIIAQGLVPAEIYEQIEQITYRLFERGQQYAASRGLILVDTKYEFGLHDGKVYLIDEVHTPDSSRYWYMDDYEERFAQGLPPRQLSKEFVRQWLMDNGFMGREGDKMPELTDEIVNNISQRYIELYQHLIGEDFVPADSTDPLERIEKNVCNYIHSIEKNNQP